MHKLAHSGSIKLATGFRVHAVRSTSDGRVELVSRGLDRSEQTLSADRVVAATGFRPDHALGAEWRLLDPVLGCARQLAPLIDPNELPAVGGGVSELVAVGGGASEPVAVGGGSTGGGCGG